MDQKKTLLSIVMVVLLISFSSLVQAEERLICDMPRSDLGGDEGWKLAKDKKGIKVYLRKTSLSPVRIFRGVAEFDVEFDRLVSLVWDGSRYTDWILLCDGTELLEEVSDTEQYLYTVNKPIWPVKKRDNVYHRKIFQDPETLAVTLQMCGVDGYLPEKKGYVRIPLLVGYAKVTPLSNGKVELIYEVLVDVGGWIPKWVIDYYQANIAYITLRRIQKMIPLEQYKDERYGFLKYPNEIKPQVAEKPDNTVKN